MEYKQYSYTIITYQNNLWGKSSALEINNEIQAVLIHNQTYQNNLWSKSSALEINN
jgi:hypothetical protein